MPYSELIHKSVKYIGCVDINSKKGLEIYVECLGKIYLNL